MLPKLLLLQGPIILTATNELSFEAASSIVNPTRKGEPALGIFAMLVTFLLAHSWWPW